jgi:hypothetical protein
VITLVFILPLLQAAGQLPDPALILEKSRDLSITGSLTSTISLIITEKSGATRKRTISMSTKSYPGGQEKRLIRFMEPADVRGTAMLVIDNKNTADEMWIYLPALKKTRRIVSTEKGKSFMSSEFSNADMSSPTLSDFTNRHIDNSGAGETWMIKSTPSDDKKADEYGFSRKVSYVGKDDYRTRKMEFYNFDNKLFKVIEIKNFQPLSGGRYLVKDMTAENLITGRKSEIIFSKITEGAVIDDSVFMVQNLER